MNSKFDKAQLQEELAELLQQHYEIDHEIEQLHAKSYSNQLHITRLKKEKLGLKEKIEKIKSALIPDQLA